MAGQTFGELLFCAYHLKNQYHEYIEANTIYCYKNKRKQKSHALHYLILALCGFYPTWEMKLLERLEKMKVMLAWIIVLFFSLEAEQSPIPVKKYKATATICFIHILCYFSGQGEVGGSEGFSTMKKRNFLFQVLLITEGFKAVSAVKLSLGLVLLMPTSLIFKPAFLYRSFNEQQTRNVIKT